MSKYMNINMIDVNGEEFNTSWEVEDSEVLTGIKTIVNKACLIVDWAGYGDYDVMYDSRILQVTDIGITTGFSCVISTLNISVTNHPTEDIGTVTSCDDFLLIGVDYNPENDPFNIFEVVTSLGAEKYDG